MVSRYRIPANCSSYYKIAVVSDLHNKRFDKIQKELVNEEPDIIFLTGDIFDRYIKDFLQVLQKESLKCLSFCGSYKPTFMCLGNHEYGIREEDKRQIEKLGIKILDDSYTKYKELFIGGLSSGNKYKKKDSKYILTMQGKPNTEWLNMFEEEKEPKFLLCHHPEYFEKYIRAKKIDLTVAGHAHGGQWRFFGQGIYSPGQGLFPKLTKGSYFNNRLIVSAGLANTGGIVPRLFNPKELVILEIEPKNTVYR